MASLIDPTKPTSPKAYTADVRANFAAAKQEIEALQALVGAGGAVYLPLSGGTMSGPLTLSGNPTQALQAATKQYVDTHGGLSDAPSDSFYYARHTATWAKVPGEPPATMNNVVYARQYPSGGPGVWIAAVPDVTSAQTEGVPYARVYSSMPSPGNAWQQVIGPAGGTITGSLTVQGLVTLPNLPTSPGPAASGQLWCDPMNGNVLKVS